MTSKSHQEIALVHFKFCSSSSYSRDFHYKLHDLVAGVIVLASVLDLPFKTRDFSCSFKNSNLDKTVIF